MDDNVVAESFTGSGIGNGALAGCTGSGSGTGSGAEGSGAGGSWPAERGGRGAAPGGIGNGAGAPGGIGKLGIGNVGSLPLDFFPLRRPNGLTSC